MIFSSAHLVKTKGKVQKRSIRHTFGPQMCRLAVDLYGQAQHEDAVASLAMEVLSYALGSEFVPESMLKEGAHPHAWLTQLLEFGVNKSLRQLRVGRSRSAGGHPSTIDDSTEGRKTAIFAISSGCPPRRSHRCHAQAASRYHVRGNYHGRDSSGDSVFHMQICKKNAAIFLQERSPREPSKWAGKSAIMLEAAGFRPHKQEKFRVRYAYDSSGKIGF